VRVETISPNPTPMAVASGITRLTRMLIQPIDNPLKKTLLAVFISPCMFRVMLSKNKKPPMAIVLIFKNTIY
jgi:hypothetical protein